jgi:hypothetical protein
MNRIRNDVASLSVPVSTPFSGALNRDRGFTTSTLVPICASLPTLVVAGLTA